MRELRDRVAVVTGAASGIGLALAERYAAEGMHVVLADVEEAALTVAADRLRAAGASVLAVTTDVSRADDVDALASEAMGTFGGVHVLCNNAGVFAGRGPIWEVAREDWEWVLGVNLWGVINGIRAFLPILLEQEEGHVVNTASMAGLLAGTLGVYSVSKHAVVALSEALQMQLAARAASVGVSVLCPGWVRTRIIEADRNRPGGREPRSELPEAQAMEHLVEALVDTGIDPAEVAGHVIDAMRSGRFYVLTHPEMAVGVEQRAHDILEGRAPVLPVP